MSAFMKDSHSEVDIVAEKISNTMSDKVFTSTASNGESINLQSEKQMYNATAMTVRRTLFDERSPSIGKEHVAISKQETYGLSEEACNRRLDITPKKFSQRNINIGPSPSKKLTDMRDYFTVTGNTPTSVGVMEVSSSTPIKSHPVGRMVSRVCGKMSVKIDASLRRKNCNSNTPVAGKQISSRFSITHPVVCTSLFSSPGKHSSKRAGHKRNWNVSPEHPKSKKLKLFQSNKVTDYFSRLNNRDVEVIDLVEDDQVPIQDVQQIDIDKCSEAFRPTVPFTNAHLLNGVKSDLNPAVSKPRDFSELAKFPSCRITDPRSCQRTPLKDRENCSILRSFVSGNTNCDSGKQKRVACFSQTIFRSVMKSNHPLTVQTPEVCTIPSDDEGEIVAQKVVSEAVLPESTIRDIGWAPTVHALHQTGTDQQKITNHSAHFGHKGMALDQHSTPLPMCNIDDKAQHHTENNVPPILRQEDSSLNLTESPYTLHHRGNEAVQSGEGRLPPVLRREDPVVNSTPTLPTVCEKYNGAEYPGEDELPPVLRREDTNSTPTLSRLGEKRLPPVLRREDTVVDVAHMPPCKRKQTNEAKCTKGTYIVDLTWTPPPVFNNACQADLCHDKNIFPASKLGGTIVDLTRTPSPVFDNACHKEADLCHDENIFPVSRQGGTTVDLTRTPPVFNNACHEEADLCHDIFPVSKLGGTIVDLTRTPPPVFNNACHKEADLCHDENISPVFRPRQGGSIVDLTQTPLLACSEARPREARRHEDNNLPPVLRKQDDTIVVLSQNSPKRFKSLVCNKDNRAKHLGQITLPTSLGQEDSVAEWTEILPTRCNKEKENDLVQNSKSSILSTQGNTAVVCTNTSSLLLETLQQGVPIVVLYDCVAKPQKTVSSCLPKKADCSSIVGISSNVAAQKDCVILQEMIRHCSIHSLEEKEFSKVEENKNTTVSPNKSLVHVRELSVDDVATDTTKAWPMDVTMENNMSNEARSCLRTVVQDSPHQPEMLHDQATHKGMCSDRQAHSSAQPLLKTINCELDKQPIDDMLVQLKGLDKCVDTAISSDRAVCPEKQILSVSCSYSSSSSRRRSSSLSSSQLISYITEVITKCREKPAQRLGLMTPKCKIRPGLCDHSKYCLVSDPEIDLIDVHFEYKLYHIALEMCSVFGQHRFIAFEILLQITHFILNQGNKWLVVCALVTLRKLLDDWPPCSAKGQAYYTQFLMEPSKNTGSNLGLFEELLLQVETIFLVDASKTSKNEDRDSDSTDEEDDLDSSMEEEVSFNPDECENFMEICAVAAMDELKFNQSYTSLSPEERSLRLGAVLEAVVHILEQNLLSYLMDKLCDHHQNLADPNKQPLVVKIVWPDQNIRNIGTMNSLCRRILRLWLASTGSIRRALLRLLALMAEVISVSEDTNMSYPNIDVKCYEFGREILNMIPNGTDIASFVTELKPSWLALLIVHLHTCRLLDVDNLVSLEIVMACLNLLSENSSLLAPTSPSERHTKCKPANINKKDKKGETRLHVVCRSVKKLDELRSLLSNPDIDVNVKDNAGWTPLHEAVAKGNKECVDILLRYQPAPGARSVDVRAKGLNGFTPLMDASISGWTNICKSLLKHAGWCLLEDKNASGQCSKDLTTNPAVLHVLNTAKDLYPYKTAFSKLSLSSRNLTKKKLMELSAVLPVYVNLYLLTYQINEITYMGKSNAPIIYTDLKENCEYMEYFYILKNAHSLRKVASKFRNMSDADDAVTATFNTIYSMIA